MKKKSLITRIFALLGGLVLLVLSGCVIAETFFHVPFTAKLGQLLGARTPVPVLLTLLMAILLFVSGVSCLLMLSARRAARRAGFVMQKSENGMIGVSVRSIEGLVQTCVKQHDVIAKADVSVVGKRDGIVILLNVEEAAGVNIPLAVGALQKQIKQYVNSCTGVDVQEVRVMVENTDNDAPESLYAVQNPAVIAAPAAAAAVPAAVAEVLAETVEEDPIQPEMVEMAAEIPMASEPVVIEEPIAEAETAPVVQPVPVVIPVMPEIVDDEEDDRPLHQRLFGAEEAPVFVPAPPELVVEPAAEELPEESPMEAAEEPDEVAAPAEDIDANAVLEVVAAMAEEELIAEEEEDAAEEETQPREDLME